MNTLNTEEVANIGASPAVMGYHCRRGKTCETKKIVATVLLVLHLLLCCDVVCN